MPYQTPANPPGSLTVNRAVLLPADKDYLALLTGAIVELIDQDNYEQPDGHQSIDDTVQFWLAVLEDWYT